MKNKGFTLIELLVVIVIIGILVAIALPNFIKIKDKAKEAEVKQNLHSIQLAIERYATDQDGNYPHFLYGGEGLFNIGTISGVEGLSPAPNYIIRYSRANVGNPFDMKYLNTDTWDYDDCMWGDILQEPIDPDVVRASFGDSIAFEGYMPKYPKNPFIQGKAAETYSINALNTSLNYFSALGGRDGTKMWCLSHWGDLINICFFSDSEDPHLEFPGNFAYHARYSDRVTNHGHVYYQADYNDGAVQTFADPDRNDYQEVHSNDVAGYDLVATGSKRTLGQDLDVNTDRLTSGIQSREHYLRTGYLTNGQERNPYIYEGHPIYPNVGDYDERPFSDSIPDYFIIHLGSGMDKKQSNELGSI